MRILHENGGEGEGQLPRDARLWCILWLAARHCAVQSPRRPDAKIPGPGGAKKFMKRPARHGISFRRPDRNLRMHVNGRLTAPPEFQAELATNSVRRNLLQGSVIRPEARGNPLDIFPS